MSDEDKKVLDARAAAIRAVAEKVAAESKAKVAAAESLKPIGMFDEKMRKSLWPTISDLVPKMPIPEPNTPLGFMGYYWRLVKLLGKEVWRSRGAEMLSLLAFTMLSLIVGYSFGDHTAGFTFKVSAVVDACWLTLFGIGHLARAPWLIYREPQKASDYHWGWGVLGAFILLLMAGELVAVGVGGYSRIQQRAYTVVMEIKPPLAPSTELSTVKPLMVSAEPLLSVSMDTSDLPPDDMTPADRHVLTFRVSNLGEQPTGLTDTRLYLSDNNVGLGPDWSYNWGTTTITNDKAWPIEMYTTGPQHIYRGKPWVFSYAIPVDSSSTKTIKGKLEIYYGGLEPLRYSFTVDKVKQ
jgi:hypothetical protein